MQVHRPFQSPNALFISHGVKLGCPNISLMLTYTTSQRVDRESRSLNLLVRGSFTELTIRVSHFTRTQNLMANLALKNIYFKKINIKIRFLYFYEKGIVAYIL